ncbi:hypothetical protein NPX13_g7065 [Xylaria arbuscula]|uniref:ERAP1-like C-terminal domain-containing protein n=1 Tax=Xylaria arbuscula TaxID=114810 RepID=A0A9W8TKT5_9PEZI|nr:hypothetical protein NPX13_g7065 [Xylaria arbuscula]
MASRKLLPTNLKPTLYRVRLEPNFDEQCFSGQVDIKYYESDETVEIEALEHFVVGENIKFVIEYRGNFTNDLAGFYQAHYTTDEDETEHHIAVTSMEPTYARQLDQLQRLIQAALEGRLSIRDAVGMSCDLRALVSAGTNKTSTLLDLCLSFKNMSDYHVWETIDKNLRAVQSAFRFQSPAVITALKKVVVDIIGSKSRELGWDISEDDDDTMVSFKASMFSVAGLAGDPEIVSAAKRMFAERVAGKENAINPSLWWETFGIVASYGGREELDDLFNIWKTSSNEDEEYLALECLGRASTDELVVRVLDLAFTKHVKDQDLYLLLWLMNSSTHGVERLWKWTKTNWDRVEKAVPVDMQGMTLGVVLDGLSTKNQMADVEGYFAERNTENYQQLLAQKMELMDVRRLWAERDLEDLTSWLVNHGYMEQSA